MSLEEQRILLRERRVLVSFKGFSASINSLEAVVAGVRLVKGACSAVSSQQLYSSEPRWEELRAAALSALHAVEGCSDAGGAVEARLYRGSVRLGSQAAIEPGEVVEAVKAACSKAGGFCEVDVELASRTRVIEHGEGVAREDKEYFIVEASVSIGQALGAERVGGLLFRRESIYKALEEAVEAASREARLAVKARPLSPLEAGRTRLVLSPEASGALLHEVSHILDPDYAGREMRGLQIGSAQLTLADEPTTPLAPSVRFFDDEGVETRRRTLVEDGRIVDMHFTMRTAARYRGRPGSAHGLFTTPRGFHTTLVAEAGDWRLEEMLEEARRGVYVETVRAAFAERGLVRLVPGLAYRIEAGGYDLKPVKIRSILVPLAKLKTITAVGRARRVRLSYEEGEWLIAEITPALLLEGYIQP